MTAIEDLLKAIAEMPPMKSEPGDYAELGDDVVNIRRRDGTLVASMPRNYYDYISERRMEETNPVYLAFKRIWSKPGP